MGAPNYHLEHHRTGSHFERIGIPGKYHSAVTVATTTTASFTSSYGYGAFMLGAGADDVDTKIYVAGSDAILEGPDLAEQRIYDIAPSVVQSTGGNIFVFKVRGI
jgi:hypothetical protein|tara:strand:- start:325 stop:639 length:315 start_codon:yes stop_codon:yes gene_type:complete